MTVTDLARPEIVAMRPYSSARAEAPGRAAVLLNANESPWSLFDSDATALELNRYPDPQPAALVEGLAERYGLPADHVLVTRGSDEGIDLLTRVFCRAGQDAVLHAPPTFGMYRIAAEAQGAAVVSVPRGAGDFALAADALLQAVRDNRRIRLVFLTSPNNPTGDAVEPAVLDSVLGAAAGHALVVVDEAYAEFCPEVSCSGWVAAHPHLVVLRTLSKGWGAAGLRCGAVLAQPEVLGLLRRIIAPYPLASPVVALAMRILAPDMPLRQQRLIREIARNKERLLALLEGRSFVRKLWPGEANFVLIRVVDAPGLLRHFAEHGVILRGFPAEPLLADCIRITVGSQRDLDALEKALDAWEDATT